MYFTTVLEKGWFDCEQSVHSKRMQRVISGDIALKFAGFLFDGFSGVLCFMHLCNSALSLCASEFELVPFFFSLQRIIGCR